VAKVIAEPKSSLPTSTTAGRTLGIESKRREMSKQAMRDETERLVKEALERKTVTVKQGQTRIETKCGKCGAPNRVSAAPGQVRVQYTCKECGEKQKTL
jgi:transposase-like protein